MIKVNSIVALKQEAEEVYDYATAPARAVVRQSRMDEGYEMVYVSWDRDHWRSVGEPNQWAFASHFEVIGIQDESEDFDASVFIDAVETAANVAAEGEGFVMISLIRDSEGELFPKVVVTSTSEEAEDILDTQVLPSLGFDE